MMLLFMAAAACFPVAGNHITGRDLAAASPAFAELAPVVDLGYAPAPGARRFFEPGELARLAKTHGLDVPSAAPLCFERAVAPLTKDQVTAAIRKSPGLAQAQIEVLAISAYPAPSGELVFPREGLAQPASGETAVWNGYVSYEGGRFAMWARVRLTLRERRVIATSDIKPGRIVEAGDVRVEEVDGFPLRVVMPDSLEQVVGRVARRLIPAGKPVAAAALGEPNDIDAGQTVAVEVRSGAAVLRLEAKAETGGRSGEIISLRNAEGGKLFRARVEGKGKAIVEAMR